MRGAKCRMAALRNLIGVLGTAILRWFVERTVAKDL